MSIVIALVGLALVGMIGADTNAFSSGIASRARAFVEEAIYRLLNQGGEMDWAKYDTRFVSPLSGPSADCAGDP